eukprot:Pgem_evm2s6297
MCNALKVFDECLSMYGDACNGHYPAYFTGMSPNLAQGGVKRVTFNDLKESFEIRVAQLRNCSIAQEDNRAVLASSRSDASTMSFAGLTLITAFISTKIF